MEVMILFHFDFGSCGEIMIILLYSSKKTNSFDSNKMKLSNCACYVLQQIAHKDYNGETVICHISAVDTYNLETYSKKNGRILFVICATAN